MKLFQSILVTIVLFCLFLSTNKVYGQNKFAPRVAGPSLAVPFYDVYLLDDNDIEEDLKVRSYKITDLGTPVGSQSLNSIESIAVYWDSDLNPVDIGNLGGNDATIRDGDNRNNFVGFSKPYPFANYWVGFYYDFESGTMIELPALGGLRSAAYGINNLNQIVGTADRDPYAYHDHPVIWEGNEIIELKVFSFDRSGSAYDINDKGQVVGALSDDGWHEPVFWESPDSVEKLSMTPGCITGAAEAINERGEMAGSCAAGRSHALYWNTEKEVEKIAPQYLASRAFDINNAGFVVGTIDYEPPFIAYIYHPRLGLFDLNERIPENTGWNLSTASGINEEGKIVGWGKYNGSEKGFLLVPRE